MSNGVAGQPRPAVAVGYRHGDQVQNGNENCRSWEVYQLDQLRSNILVRLCTTKGAGDREHEG